MLNRWPHKTLFFTEWLGKASYSTANSAVVILIWREAVNSGTAWFRILDLGELAESMGWLGNTCVHSSACSVTLQQLWNSSCNFKAEGTVFWLTRFTQASWLFWYKEIVKECVCFQCIDTELGLSVSLHSVSVWIACYLCLQKGTSAQKVIIEKVSERLK